MIKFLKCKGFKVGDPERNLEENAGFDIRIPEANEHVVKVCEGDNVGENTNGVKLFKESDGKWQISIPVGKVAVIDSGLKTSFSQDIVLEVCNKSGIGRNKRVIPACGIIDSSYQGPLKICVLNVSDKEQTFPCGSKFIQLVPKKIDINPYEILDENDISVEDFYDGIKTERGEGGFGSTGI